MASRAPRAPARGDPTVTRDGRLIAFTWMLDGANQALFVMRRDRTRASQITATKGVIEGSPDWQGSP